MNKTAKTIGNTLFIFMMIFFTWISFSVVEVWLHQMTMCEYSEYNFFIYVMNFVENIK